jgi:hypothetical protein
MPIPDSDEIAIRRLSYEGLKSGVDFLSVTKPQEDHIFSDARTKA